MRKILSLTLVAIMLLSTIALTSCDAVKGFVDGFLGKETVPNKTEVRTTITEMEWLEIYELSNYTMTLEAEGVKYTVVSAGDLIKIEYFMQDFQQTITVDIKEGCILTNSSLGWLGYKEESISLELYINLGAIGFLDEIEFSQLTYEEQTKSYIHKNEEAIYEFCFEDGVLVRAKGRPLDIEEEGKLEITDIGTTTLERPEYTIVNDGKPEPSTADASVRTTITLEDLAAHLDLRNITLRAVVLDMGMVGEISVKLAESGIEMSISSMYENEQQYIAFLDGEIYSLYENEGEYVGSHEGSLEQLETLISDAKENLTLDYLVYDEEGRYYKLELDEAGSGFYFYFENGQLVKGTYVVNAGNGYYTEVIFGVFDIGTTEVDIPEFIYPVEDSAE